MFRPDRLNHLNGMSELNEMKTFHITIFCNLHSKCLCVVVAKEGLGSKNRHVG